jgi:hypothetical protein
MQYQTLFDFAATGYGGGPFPVIAAAVVAVNLVLWLFFPKVRGRTGMHVFSAVMILLIVLLPYWDYAHLRAAYRNKAYRVTEGKVENYWYRKWYSSRNKRTNEQEGFTVGGVKFAYNFNSQASFTNGGNPRIAFRDGMTLRICYLSEEQLDADRVDNRILKLEIQGRQEEGLKGANQAKTNQ